MSIEGRGLGMALMEANSPTVRANMELRGTVRGETAKEIAEKANAIAYEFFNGLGHYDLDIAVESTLILGNPKKGEMPPRWTGTYYARLR